MDTFNSDGKYNKTDWQGGDIISANKLNKIEDALDQLNNNDISIRAEIETLESENSRIEAECKSEISTLDLSLTSRINMMDTELNIKIEQNSTCDADLLNALKKELFNEDGDM